MAPCPTAAGSAARGVEWARGDPRLGGTAWPGDTPCPTPAGRPASRVCVRVGGSWGEGDLKRMPAAGRPPLPRRPSPRRGPEPERHGGGPAGWRELLQTLQKFVTHDKFLQQKIVMGDKFLQSVVLMATPSFCRFLSPMTIFCKDRQVILLNSGVKCCRIRTYVL